VRDYRANRVEFAEHRPLWPIRPTGLAGPANPEHHSGNACKTAAISAEIALAKILKLPKMKSKQPANRGQNHLVCGGTVAAAAFINSGAKVIQRVQRDHGSLFSGGSLMHKIS